MERQVGGKRMRQGQSTRIQPDRTKQRTADAIDDANRTVAGVSMRAGTRMSAHRWYSALTPSQIHGGAQRKGAGADLHGRIFIRANMPGLVAAGVHLEDAVLDHAYLAGADLRGVHLTHIHVHGADLRGANLRGADLTGADLSKACRLGADLTGAQLDRADITGAAVQGTTRLGGPDEVGAALAVLGPADVSACQ
jgi:uncharacterized protein YjbI with pentapeptide repeats